MENESASPIPAQAWMLWPDSAESATCKAMIRALTVYSWRMLQRLRAVEGTPGAMSGEERILGYELLARDLAVLGALQFVEKSVPVPEVADQLAAHIWEAFEDDDPGPHLYATLHKLGLDPDAL